MTNVNDWKMFNVNQMQLWDLILDSYWDIEPKRRTAAWCNHGDQKLGCWGQIPYDSRDAPLRPGADAQGHTRDAQNSTEVKAQHVY